MPTPSIVDGTWLVWLATVVAGLAVLACVIGLARPYDVRFFDRPLWPALIGLLGFVLLVAAASASRWPRAVREALRFLGVAGTMFAVLAVLTSLALFPPTEDVSSEAIPGTDLTAVVVQESSGVSGEETRSVVVRGQLGPFDREQVAYWMGSCPGTMTVENRTVVVEMNLPLSGCRESTHRFVVQSNGWTLAEE